MSASAVTNKQGDLRVWWIPQIPGKPFHVEVVNLAEAKKIMEVLANYDIFQFENRIKPDYSNVGGLECFRQHGAPVPADDLPDWCEWESEDGDNIGDYEVAA
jgi:hypothetical protein